MLNSLDIALLCDSRTVDGAGLAITPDRSRHGIHAQLGDGATAGTMPTLDALNGRYTFDGGDYMVLRQADDVDDVLADMASDQDETYLYYIFPMISTVDYAYLLSTNYGAGGYYYIRQRETVGTFYWQATFNDGIGSETATSGVNSILPYYNKGILLAVRRGSNVIEFWVNGVLISSTVVATRDASNAKDVLVGAVSAAITYPFPAGTGLRFFGYSRTAWTQTQLRALQRFLRGNL